MSESFDLQAYLSKGIEDFMKDLLKATLTNPRGSAFMLRFAAATAARGLLFPLQPRDRGRRARAAADERGMAQDLQRSR